MSVDFSAFAEQLRQLNGFMPFLISSAHEVGIASPEKSDWYELLRHKLLPQMEMPPALVVAIIGGTNIGKSVIFNHLAGERASASTPLAAGTKHPVCLVPPGLDEPELLKKLFEPFTLLPWHSADDPLEASEENLLFWRLGKRLPPRLLLLDAPDVDSDVTMNWNRAKAIREVADVLLAVLTQQKYNDATIKQFFRAAVEADKPIVVIFNQCDLQADREYWPQWLKTFCEETSAHPDRVYVMPYDRKKAETLKLPFYEVGPDGQKELGKGVDLRDQLASLHFDTIKIQTLRGALGRVLDKETGLPAYLQDLQQASGDFATAAKVLSAEDMAKVEWPLLPSYVLVDEIGAWWDASRQPWSQKIHGFYRGLGRGLTWPIRTVWGALSGPGTDPLLFFQQRERAAIVSGVEKLLTELGRLAEVGNETLRPRLMRLLGGHARSELLIEVQEAHANLPAVDEDYRHYLREELGLWRTNNPRAIQFLQSLDHLAALTRPAISVSLFFTGWHFAGNILGQATTQVASHTASQLALEAAITGGITGGGEALVSTTSEGVRQAAGRLFLRLQQHYAQKRAQWLASWIETKLLGDLIGELTHGAALCHSDEYVALDEVVEGIQRAMRSHV